MKKKGFLLLAVLLIASIGLWVNANAEIISGTTAATYGGSKNIFYSLDTDTGTITISGTGGWADYEDYAWMGLLCTPYDNYKSTIKKVIIEEGVTSVAGTAFSGCSNLTSVTMASSVSRIGYKAFNGCSSLRTITLPSGLTRIENAAFNGCSALRDISFPDSLISIGDSAFQNDGALKGEIVTYGDIGNDAFRGTSISKIDIRNCNKIGVAALRECPNLKTVVLCEGIEIIPDEFVVFDPLLSSVSLPSTVTTIGENAFNSCTGLKSISLPEGLLSLKYQAFAASGLTSITLPSSVMNLGERTFAACESLRSANVPASCETVVFRMFAKCSNLRDVNIDEGIYQISEQAFSECTSLQTIQLPSTIESIGKYAFEYCKMLKQADIPDKVEVIGESAFSNCEALTSVKIPEGIVTINSSVFERAGLTTVELPLSLITVKKSAFYGNPITKVIYPGTREQWTELNIESGNDALIDGYEVRVASVTLDQEEATLYRTTDNSTPDMQLIATVLPENAWTTKVQWESSDTDVATVDENGKVTAVNPGMCAIICRSEDKSQKSTSCSIKVENQPITSITFNQETETLTRTSDEANPTLQLTVTILPNNAWSKELVWETSNDYVATVDKNGVVKANAPGSCEIYCRAKNENGYDDDDDYYYDGVSSKGFEKKDQKKVTAVCTITVENQKITSITLNGETETLIRTPDKPDPTLQLQATILPENAWNKQVIWESSDYEVAYVDQNGLVTAQGIGTCEISCQSIEEDYDDYDYYDDEAFDDDGYISSVFSKKVTKKDREVIKAVYKITVENQKVTKITLNKTKAVVKKGKTLTLKVKKIAPNDAYNKEVIWKSNKTKVAKVNQEGVVTAVGVGTAKITCTAADGSGVVAKCTITVPQPVTKITLSKTKLTLKKGKSFKLKATVKPKNAADKKVVWSSSNKKVAKVDKKGKVTAVGAGTCVITCKAADGSGVKATCKITVKKSKSTLSLGLPCDYLSLIILSAYPV